MVSSFHITPEIDRPRVFPCPVCNQTIDTSQERCRFCFASIDPIAAEAAADALAKVNQACSDADEIEAAADHLLRRKVIRTFGPNHALETIYVALTVPWMTIRWFIKHGKIKSDDPEFRVKKKIVTRLGIPLMVIALAFPAIVIACVVFFLLF